MKKLLSLLFLLSASLTFGQVIQSRVVSVEKGKNQKFRAGVEKKTKMYNAKEGQLRFYTFNITSGANTGKYFRVRYEDEIAGFDVQVPKAAGKLWKDEVSQYVSNSQARWMWYSKEASHVSVSPFDKPLRRVMEYTYKADMSDEFWRFRNNVANAIKSSRADIFLEVWNCGSGCDGNMAMFVFGHSNYAEMGSDNSDEWMKVYKKYNKIYGEDSYEKDLENFSKSLEMYGRRTYDMEFAPEMSSPENMSKLDKLTTD